MTGLSTSMCLVMVALGLLVVLLAGQTLYGALTDNKQTSGSLISGNGKSRKARDLVLLVGPSGSGKTQLFYRLLTREVKQTVSSSDVNQTDDFMEVKVPSAVVPNKTEGESSQVSIALKLVDIPGHFNFREKMQEALDKAKAVILVLDAKEKEKFPEAAEILYDVIGNLGIVTDQVPVAVACNKQDLTFAKKAIQVERDLTSQIEQIRKVRKATREQNQDTSQAANKTQDDQDIQENTSYLESLRGRFSFEQLATPVQFLDCSVLTESMDDLYRFVYKHQ